MQDSALTSIKVLPSSLVGFFMQVDDQWKSVLSGLCSQYANAIASEYLPVCSAAQHQNSAAARLTLGKYSTAEQISLSASASAEESTDFEGARDAMNGKTQEQFERPSRPSCSGYDEVHSRVLWDPLLPTTCWQGKTLFYLLQRLSCRRVLAL